MLSKQSLFELDTQSTFERPYVATSASNLKRVADNKYVAELGTSPESKHLPVKYNAKIPDAALEKKLSEVSDVLRGKGLSAMQSPTIMF